MRSFKKIAAECMTVVIAVSSLTGCDSSLLNKEKKDDSEDILNICDDFLDAVLDLDFKKMKKLVTEDNQKADYFGDGAVQISSITEDIFAETVYEADEDSVSVKKDKSSAEYNVTMPDPEDVVDLFAESSDLDEALKNADIKEFTVTIELESEDDEWLVSNIDEILDDMLFADVDISDVSETEPQATETETVPETAETEVTVEPTVEATPEPAAEAVQKPTIEPPVVEPLEYSTDYTLDDIINANWDDFVVCFDGQVLEFPFPYYLLADRWDLPEECPAGYYINVGRYVIGRMASKEEDLYMWVDLYNLGYDSPIDAVNAVITRMEYDSRHIVGDEYVHSELHEFTLPKGITLGSSIDDVINAYGEPTNRTEYQDSVILEYKDDNYNSLTLKCNVNEGVMGFEYTTSRYYWGEEYGYEG